MIVGVNKITLIAGTAVALVGVILFPQDVAGWTIFILTICAVSLDTELRRQPIHLCCALIVLLAHHGVAIINAYWFTVIGAEADAHTFDIYAQSRGLADLNAAIGMELYRNFLIVAYQLAGNSLFLGEQLSIFAFTAALLIFYRLLMMAGIKRLGVVLLLAFGLAPHILIYTSLTLREAWELLFFVTTVYYGIRFRKDFHWLSLLLLVLSTICLGLLHRVLIPFALILAAILLVWPISRTARHVGVFSTALTIGLIVGFSFASINVLSTQKVIGIGLPLKVYQGDTDNFLRIIKAHRHRINQDNPRTGFGYEIDASSIPALLWSLPRLGKDYLFAPFPWNITNINDLPIALVSLLRLCLIAIGVFGLWEMRRSRYFYLFITLYVIACSTWILGTTNYGQASRHHVFSDWLLLLIAGMVLQHRHRKYLGPG